MPNPQGCLIAGLDVGSTTVKAVVAQESCPHQILWREYQRHEAKQPEKVLEFLSALEADLGFTAGRDRLFVTGSGASSLAPLLGAKFVQEVAAVSMAVEILHPEVNSVIELGGQDAKIIVFRNDGRSARKTKIPSMNDKCAGGTGAVIDKIAAKLRIDADALCQPGLPRARAAPGRRQVRRLRRDRHQRTPEAWSGVRRAHGVTVRCHRAAEPHGARAGPHAAPPRSAAWRSQHVHTWHARGLAAQHPPHVGRATRRGSGRRGHRLAHPRAGQRSVLRCHRRD